VYDSYLNVSGAGVAADKMRQAVAGFASLGTSMSDLGNAVVSLTKSASLLQVTTVLASSALTTSQAEDLGDALIQLRAALDDDKTPEQIVAEVYDALDGHNYGEETIKFMVSAAISIMLGVAFGTLAATGPVGILVGVAIGAVNLCSMAYVDMYQYVAWLGMGYSLSGRIPGRILRYYGMW
jgi:hypothetical protein